LDPAETQEQAEYTPKMITTNHFSLPDTVLTETATAMPIIPATSSRATYVLLHGHLGQSAQKSQISDRSVAAAPR